MQTATHHPGGEYVLMLSGGIDSAVTAYWAKSEGLKITSAVFLDYGQEAADRELHCARRQAIACGFPFEVAVMPNLKYLFYGVLPYHLHPMMAECQCGDLTAPYGIVATYAVLRQSTGLLVGLIRNDVLVTPGIPEFISTFSEAVSVLHGTQFVIYAPLIDTLKPDIIQRGARLGANFGDTWACYDRGSVHCGKCPGCQNRAAAFASANIGTRCLTRS